MHLDLIGTAIWDHIRRLLWKSSAIFLMNANSIWGGKLPYQYMYRFRYIRLLWKYSKELLRSKHTRRFYCKRHEGEDIAGACINTLERFTSKWYNGHAHKLPIKICIISFFGVVDKFRPVKMSSSRLQHKQPPHLLLNLSSFQRVYTAYTIRRQKKNDSCIFTCIVFTNFLYILYFVVVFHI